LEKLKAAIIGGSDFEHLFKDAGLQDKISPLGASETSKRIMPQLEQALIQALAALPLTREGCSCYNALEDARFA
jgi:hypothetical protein